MTEPPPGRQASGDAAARERIARDLTRSLLVEAGAGSGKTHELTRRMAAGIASGVYELEGMAAVTFTRKAAAELRARFQLALEAELAAAGPPDRQRRVQTALSNLERFFAGTIHAFCARLLRERPVEAGVSPGFTELDDVEERLLREQSWRDDRAQARAAGDDDLAELIEAGLTAKQLDKAFEMVCLHEDVEFPAPVEPKPDAGPAFAALERFWAALKPLLPKQIDPKTTCKTQQRAVRFERAWRGYLRGRRDHALVNELLRGWESKPGVVLKAWSDKPTAKAAEQLHENLRAEVVAPFQKAWRQYLYRICVSLLTRARDAAQADRRRRNALSFNDLLIVTARMLRTNADVRRALRQKYRWLFVDEFQDTDPVQAEIMFWLAAEDDGTLRPGSLFVVGDPKQSIYRFRRADIEIYNDVRARLGGSDGSGVVSLTTNFRSVPALCDWANRVFERRFPAEPTAQAPRFAPLDADRQAGPGPAIAVIDLPAAIDATDLPVEEAARIARYIRAEVDAGRREFGDFLILTRRKRGLRAYADALEAHLVPIEVTGAGAFGQSSEVRALALLLTALADPQDAVALVGVLRGPLFGSSDADLFAFRQAGGYFNVFAEIDAPDEPARRVGAALASLREWLAWTRVLPTGAALERILESSGYLALAATSPGGVEAGDLLHAIDRVRAVVEDGFTLADAAEALASWSGLDDDGPEESVEVDSLPLEPGRRDVVRLMNVHKAKGLEAPVVFLADPLGGWEPRVDVRIVRGGVRDRVRDGAADLQVGGGPRAQGYFQIVAESTGYARRVLAEPPDWDAHETTERAFLDAELDRLLYVAATRARDLLIVGRYQGTRGNRKAAWDVLAAATQDAPALSIPGRVALPAPPAVDLSAAAAAEAAERTRAAHDQVREPSWSVTSVTAEARRLPRVAIEAPDVLDAADPTRVILPTTPSHRADAGVAWGRLVHGLLEHAMRHPASTRDDLRRLAMWLTMDDLELRPVIDRALDTVDAVAQSEEWREARAAAERHEEVPFAVADAQGRIPHVVIGVIDLVHRTPDGWRVVDYKTDVDLGDADAQRQYAAQVRRYAEAWAGISSSTVDARIVAARASGTSRDD